MKILLAVDGSEHSQAATSLLCDLPLPSESLITPVSVLAPLRAYQQAELEYALEQARLKLKSAGHEVTPELLKGNPASEIVEFADQQGSDLIVLGAKGLRATLGILLGGVAQHIVELANQPVLVVRAPYTKLQRLLLVIDGSIHSQGAIEFLARFPPSPKIKVKVMHVLPPPPTAELFAKFEMLNQYATVPSPAVEIEKATSYDVKEKEYRANIFLDKAIDALKSAGVKVSKVVQIGDAASEIIEFADEHNIDIIIAGSRGLSQVRGFLLGSVSRKLVHYSGRSVLIVKGE